MFVWRLTLAVSQVMPYSTGCKTELSNFESGLNYKVQSCLPCPDQLQVLGRNILLEYLLSVS